MDSLRSKFMTKDRDLCRDFCTRDPVHGWISLPVEVIPVINSPFFQRLYHVKQLSSTELVYTGATHTRGAHSLGVAHIARKYASRLFPKDKKKELIIVIAALLHDIGHGPFSHIWDRVVYNLLFDEKDVHTLKKDGHDQQRFRILEAMRDILPSMINISDIYHIWKQDTEFGRIANLLIQGPLGADRMDFVMRDAHYTGTEHFGTISIDRIISNSFIREVHGCNNIYYSEKILGDITHAIRARMHMYREVYLHKTAVAASALLEEAIKKSFIDHDILERSFDLNKFVLLNDGILYELANSSNEDVSILARRYLMRDLPAIKKLGTSQSFSPSPEDEKLIRTVKVKDYTIDQLDDMIGIVSSNGDTIKFSEALEKEMYGSLDMQAEIYFSITL
jgi:uncharacterized protein